jgi:hypothetical protein
MADREKTAKKMRNILRQTRYQKVPDALGMVDVMPQALGVEADGIRLFLLKTFHEPNKTMRAQTHFQRRVSSITAAIGFKKSSQETRDIEAGRKARLEREVRTPGKGNHSLRSYLAANRTRLQFLAPLIRWHALQSPLWLACSYSFLWLC